MPEDAINSLKAEIYLIEAFGYEKLVEISLGQLRIAPRSHHPWLR